MLGAKAFLVVFRIFFFFLKEFLGGFFGYFSFSGRNFLKRTISKDEVQKDKQSWKIWSQESKKQGSSEQKCRSCRDHSTLPLNTGSGLNRVREKLYQWVGTLCKSAGREFHSVKAQYNGDLRWISFFGRGKRIIWWLRCGIECVDAGTAVQDENVPRRWSGNRPLTAAWASLTCDALRRESIARYRWQSSSSKNDLARNVCWGRYVRN